MARAGTQSQPDSWTVLSPRVRQTVPVPATGICSPLATLINVPADSARDVKSERVPDIL